MKLNDRELKRISDSLISLADEFYTDTAGNLYDLPVEELKGMIDEIRSLKAQLCMIVREVIKQKEKNNV